MVRGAAERLLEALNASTSLEEVQEAVVSSVGGLIDVPAHAIYYLDPVTLEPLRVRAKGASDSFLSTYEEIGRPIDPVLERIMVEARALHSGGMLDDRAWRAHAFYPVVAQGGFDATMQAPIVVEGELVGTLDFARRRRDGGFRRADARLLDVVARRVADAVARALRFEELARQSTLVEVALDTSVSRSSRPRSTRRSSSRTGRPRSCSAAPAGHRRRCRGRSRRPSPPTHGACSREGGRVRAPSPCRLRGSRRGRSNGRSTAGRPTARSGSAPSSSASARQ